MGFATPTNQRTRGQRENLDKSLNGRTSFATIHTADSALTSQETDDLHDNDIDPALDATFASPGKNTGLNRRTSSLLARAELFHNDQRSFTLPSSLPGLPRRGPSFGAAGRVGNNGTGAQGTPAALIRRSGIGGSVTEAFDVDDTIMRNSGLTEHDKYWDEVDESDMFNHLKPELLMKRIFTKPIGDPFANNDVSMLPSPEDVEVFTMLSASSQNSNFDNIFSLSVFVVNRKHSILFEIALEVQRMQLSGTLQDLRGSHGTEYHVPPDQVKFRAYKDVLGAAPVVDGTCSRVVRLANITNGQDLLSILCLLYTSPSPRDGLLSRMPSSA